jgi:hypothetical protein
VAVNCWVPPCGIDGFAGVTVIDTSAAGPTVKVVLPVTPPDTALICDVPWDAPLKRPLALIVPTAVFDDAQVAELLRS